MSAGGGTIIDGKAIAERCKERIRAQVAQLPMPPGITVVLVGDDPASKVYVSMKEVGCRDVGMRSEQVTLPKDVSQERLLATIDRLNEDPEVHAILVQLPLPGHIDEGAVLERVRPEKDVDGFHPCNVGLLQLGKATLVPCTPKGVVRLLEESGVAIAGAHAVIVGRSNIVGKPLAQLLLQRDATVTVCHSRTKGLAALTRQADILVAAVGRPGLITAEMVKDGAVVIDVGVNRVEDAHEKRGYRLCGDVDFARVREKARAITPVPGGVGPMTIAMLMENTLLAAQAQQQARGRAQRGGAR